MKITTKTTLIIALSILLLLGSFLYITQSLFLSNLEKENNLLKTIILTDNKISDVDLLSKKADSFYSEASFNYENMDYKDLESNCRLARENYNDASQKYLNIVSELEFSGISDNLINIKAKSLKLLSEIQLNMYEACEHFESAARYYDIYFNTNVSSYDKSYEMGGKEIDAMNEKIKLHDENVRKYNELLSRFQAELEKRIDS